MGQSGRCTSVRIRVLQRLCSVIGAVLGAAGCEATRRPEPPYGVPCVPAEYQVSGTVRQAATHAPVPGIQVTLSETSGPPVASTLTDAAGNYAAERVDCSYREPTLRVLAHDVDGAANGSYRDAEATVKFLSSDIRAGRAAKVVDFDLDPQ